MHQFYNSHDIYKYYRNLIYECIVPNYHHIMSKTDICVYVQLSSFEMDNKTQLRWLHLMHKIIIVSRLNLRDPSLLHKIKKQCIHDQT